MMTVDPVATFVELARTHDRMFWLDGGGSRSWSGRESLLGGLEDADVSLTYDARTGLVLRHQDRRAVVVGIDPFDVLAAEVARDAGDPEVRWVGWFGYAARSDLPARLDRPTHPTEVHAGPEAVPDAVWMRVRRPLLVQHPVITGAAASGAAGVAPAPAPTAYAHAFATVQRELRRGNSYEVNLTYRESLITGRDPVTSYLQLRTANPSPYAGFVRHGAVALLSSSPERFATVDADRWLETRPIKGTTPRGGTPAEDAAQVAALGAHPRYRAENLMIVDLLRNDVSSVCTPGTVSVPTLMEVESYAAVHQLVSTVRGRLRPGVSTVEALRALFPAGSMTGAPKLRTMEIIAAVEESTRGVYAGAFGWLAADGRADLGVVIRSLVATPSPQAAGRWRYELGTGGGITVRSEREQEYAETRWKAEQLRSAVAEPRGRVSGPAAAATS